MFVIAAFHRTGKEATAWSARASSPAAADKATLAGETTDDLLVIETRQHTTKRHLYQVAYNLIAIAWMSPALFP